MDDHRGDAGPAEGEDLPDRLARPKERRDRALSPSRIRGALAGIDRKRQACIGQRGRARRRLGPSRTRHECVEKRKLLPCGLQPIRLYAVAPPVTTARHLERNPIDGLPVRCVEAREALRHDDDHAKRARHEGQRPRRDLALGRRAGFRHARPHQGGRDRRHPPRRDEIHPRRRHSAVARGDLRQVQAREQARLQAVPDHRRHRRQACDLQRAARHLEPRRRGDRAGALLGELSRDDRALRRHARHRRLRHRARLQAAAGAISSAPSPRRPNGSS